MRSYGLSIDQLEKIERKIIEDFWDMNKSFDIDSFNPEPSSKNALVVNLLLCVLI